MPIPTPDQLRAALRDHPRPADAFAALGTTKAGVYLKRDGQHTHPELVAILREHAAAGHVPRGAGRKAGEHSIALPAATVALLDALAAKGRRRGSRAAVARQLIEDALLGPLPDPLPADGAMKRRLDLGPAWPALGAKAGTTDPQEIAGYARAILTRGGIDRKGGDDT